MSDDLLDLGGRETFVTGAGPGAEAAARSIIRRFGEPRDVAVMTTFLQSPPCGRITKLTFPVNGGFSANQ